jgi:pseudouridine kinase
MIHEPVEKASRTPLVAIAGGANIDIQGVPYKNFIPGDSNPGNIYRSFGGVGRNIAENLVRLGFRVSLVAAFGDDEDGRALADDCRHKGIDIDSSFPVCSRSAAYLCLVDAKGALVGAVADMKAMDLLVPSLFEQRRDLFDQADYIVVDANLPRESLAWFASEYGRNSGRAHRPRLFADPVSCAKACRLKDVVGSFDCVKPNLAEAKILAGIKSTDSSAGSDDAQATIERLIATGTVPAHLFISMGEKGLYAWSDPGVHDGYTGLISMPKQRAQPSGINRSGAGDALCAGLVWADYRGCGTVDMAKYGLAAAMIAASSKDPVSAGMSESSLMHLKNEVFGRSCCS